MGLPAESKVPLNPTNHPKYHQILVVSSVAHVPLFQQILYRSSIFLRNPNKQTNKQTNADENITSLAEVMND